MTYRSKITTEDYDRNKADNRKAGQQTEPCQYQSQQVPWE